MNLNSSNTAASTHASAAWRILQWNGEVRYFAKRGDGSVLGGWIRSEEGMRMAARNLSALGYDVYVHLNPSKGPGLKASSRQVTVWRHILIDLDPIEPTIDAQSILEDAVGFVTKTLYHNPKWWFQDRLQVFHGISSGRGAQLWMCLQPYELHWPGDLKLVEHTTSAFLRAFKAEWNQWGGYRVDVVCSDAARIARCPGTINQRTGNMARVVFEANDRLDYAPMFTAFYSEPAAIEYSRPEECSNLLEASPHLNNLAREFLHAGVEEGERHHAAYTAAIELLRVGMAYRDVVFWVTRGVNKCANRMAQDEIIHCCAQALKREADVR